MTYRMKRMDVSKKRMFPCDLHLYAKFWNEFEHEAIDIDELTATDSFVKGRNHNSNINSGIIMESNNEIMAKKSRIWNPALDDCYNKPSNNNKETISVDFQNNHSSQNQQNLMQPYNNTIMQTEYSKGTPNHDKAVNFRLNIMLLPNYLMNTMLNPNFTPFNMPNHNCCAVCGSIFRLTTDLVQHMRINHRTKHYSQLRKRIAPR